MRFAEGPSPTPDGATLWTRAWEPDGRPRAAGVLVHGLGEHGGRYAHVGERFARASLALYSFDLRGHGRSSGRRGDTRFEPTLDDVDRRLADAAATGAPAFLYGHSLGALIVLTHLVRRRPALAGAVVSAPPLRNALRQQRAKVALSRALGRLLPGLALPTGLDPRDLSRDPAVVEAYRGDRSSTTARPSASRSTRSPRSRPSTQERRLTCRCSSSTAAVTLSLTPAAAAVCA